MQTFSAHSSVELMTLKMEELNCTGWPHSMNIAHISTIQLASNFYSSLLFSPSFYFSSLFSLSQQTLLTQDHRQTDIKWKCQLLSSGMYNSIRVTINCKTKIQGDVHIAYGIFIVWSHHSFTSFSLSADTPRSVFGSWCGMWKVFITSNS